MTEPTEDTVHNDRVWGAGRWVHCEPCGAVHHVDYHRRGAGRREERGAGGGGVQKKAEREFLLRRKAEDERDIWRRRAMSLGYRDPALVRRPYSRPTLTVDPNPCCAGWDATERSPSCNYTGGHYCAKKGGHGGMHVCVCGSRAGRKADPE